MFIADIEVNQNILSKRIEGKRVLVTGHTGFKGSWLSIWLHELGAEVVGVGLEPYSEVGNTTIVSFFIVGGMHDSRLKTEFGGAVDAIAQQESQRRPRVVFAAFVGLALIKSIGFPLQASLGQHVGHLHGTSEQVGGKVGLLCFLRHHAKRHEE